jgi:DNA adenine methylase
MDDLFNMPALNGEKGAVVNVATVPQRSPFRYPGGKTWLIPRIRTWLRSRPAEVLIEPFAGGGIVALTAVMEGFVQRGVMVERDEDIAAVWKTILSDRAEWLADRIMRFDLTVENVQAVLNSSVESVHDRAFATILKNRCQRGGILADGAGLIKQGENGKGIRSRWYPSTLRKRILAIAHYAHRFEFIEGDAFEVMRRERDRDGVAWFIDPPYTIAGKRLYRYPNVDHQQLFASTAMLAGDFLMTYDNAEPVRRLACEHGFQTRTVAMKNTHHAQQTELLVGRNLDWVTE